MRKILALLLILAITLPVMAQDTEGQTGFVGVKSNYFAQYQIVTADSNTLNVADTSYAFPLYPWGLNQPFPDAITLFMTFTEVGSNTQGDSLVLNVDLNRTNAAKDNANWITMNRDGVEDGDFNGQTDTLSQGFTAGASGLIVWEWGSEELSQVLPYARIRWNYPGDNKAAADSFNVNAYVIYTYTGWKDK